MLERNYKVVKTTTHKGVMEMKCPYCNGKGYYYQESSYGMELVQCNCQNKMTNEEWFCNLSTKEKAKVIVNIHNLANIDQIEWWLKEIHQ